MWEPGIRKISQYSVSGGQSNKLVHWFILTTSSIIHTLVILKQKKTTNINSCHTLFHITREVQQFGSVKSIITTLIEGKQFEEGWCMAYRGYHLIYTVHIILYGTIFTITIFINPFTQACGVELLWFEIHVFYKKLHKKLLNKKQYWHFAIKLRDWKVLTLCKIRNNFHFSRKKY